MKRSGLYGEAILKCRFHAQIVAVAHSTSARDVAPYPDETFEPLRTKTNITLA